MMSYVNGTGGAYILGEPYPVQVRVKCQACHVVLIGTWKGYGAPETSYIAYGPLVSEVVQVFSETLQVTVRLYEDSLSKVEIRIDVGPLSGSHEPIIRFTTDIDSQVNWLKYCLTLTLTRKLEILLQRRQRSWNAREILRRVSDSNWQLSLDGIIILHPWL